jgi:hypothetical protein
MPTTTPTILDQISAEKTKISERLARLDTDRAKIATQLTDLETAERVLTRVSKAPPGRKPRSASIAEVKAPTAARGRRGQPPTAATSKSAGRKPSAPSLGERVLGLATGQNPTRALRGMYRRSPEPCRHRGTAPYPRRTDPEARRQTLCDTDCSGAGTRDSLTRDHRSATAQLFNWFDEPAARAEAPASRRPEQPSTPPLEEDSCAL